MPHHQMEHIWLVTEAKVPEVPEVFRKSLLFVVPEDNEKNLKIVTS